MSTVFSKFIKKNSRLSACCLLDIEGSVSNYNLNLSEVIGDI
jgi:hypothetical protein